MRILKQIKELLSGLKPQETPEEAIKRQTQERIKEAEEKGIYEDSRTITRYLGVVTGYSPFICEFSQEGLTIQTKSRHPNKDKLDTIETVQIDYQENRVFEAWESRKFCESPDRTIESYIPGEWENKIGEYARLAEIRKKETEATKRTEKLREKARKFGLETSL